MTFYKKIEIVHFEITSRCNAACPMCPRFMLYSDTPNALNPNLSLGEIRLDQFKTIFPEDFVKGLKKFRYCGNFGDPIAAKDLLETAQYLKGISPDIDISIHTNGGAKSPEWWRELAKTMNGTGAVVFGIDGLEDTNHLYRRNVNWNRLMDNVEAYMDAGGRGVWQMLVFKHNQHQINDVMMKTIELGMGIDIRSTSRFRHTDRLAVYDKDGTLTHHLEEPDTEYRNEVNERFHKLRDGSNLSNIMETTNISCIAQERQEIYVDYMGNVFPCCWLASSWLGRYKSEINLDNHIDISQMNALEHHIVDIANGPVFSSIQRSWDKDYSGGRIATCASFCGDDTRFQTSRLLQLTPEENMEIV